MPRVYRLPGVPVTFEGRLTAVRLWMGDEGFFTGRTAAYISKLQGIERPRLISIACTQNARLPGWVQAKRLDRDDRPPTRNVHGFRLPNTERILLDLARECEPKVSGAALDDALRRKMVTIESLAAFLDAEGRLRPGAAVMRQLLRGRDDRDGKLRSEFEARMLKILRRIKEHRAVPNHMVETEGETFFIDFYVPDAVLGIECHSWRWHEGGFSERDGKRDRKIKRAGIDLVYFTWDEVTFDPRGVEAEVRASIAARIALLKGLLPRESR